MRMIDTIISKLGLTRTSEAEKKIQEAKAQSSAIVGSYYTTSKMGIAQEKEYSQLVDAYKSWVYTCIDKIAKAVAMIPLKLYVYRKEGKKIISPSFRHALKMIPTPGERKIFLKEIGTEREEITDHPFIELIHHPNAFMTRFMLWYETMVRLELGGLCGWLLVNNGLRIPKEIWPLPLTKFARLRPKVSPKLVLEYWDYQDGEVNQRFKPQEILAIKYPHPASPFQAMSPLMAQTYPYDIDLFLMQQQRALFEHGAMPGLHLTTDQKLTKELVKELREQINEQFAGAIKSGETLITHSGLKAEKLGMTTREAMIREVERFSRDKLITAYDLSPGKVGLVEDVNRANAEALNETFIQECLRPKCMMIEEVLETFLLPIYDEGLTCDFELPDYGDKAFKLLERQTNLITMYTSINEERAKEGKEPVPWGNKPWVSFTLTQAGGEVSKPLPEKSVKLMDNDFWTDERKDIAWKLFVRKSEKLEQIFLGPLRQYFKIQADEVIKRLDREGKKILGQYQGWSRQKVEQHLRSNKAVEDINIDKAEEEKKLQTIFTPIVKVIMKEIGDARIRDLLESIKLARIDFDVNDPAVLKWIGARMKSFSREVSGTSFDEIEAILKVGFSEGQPVATIADTLREKFDSWDKYRAPLISRTETISAMNEADLESVRQTGLDEKLLKHWLTAGDERVRDSHLKAGNDYQDGIAVDEEFIVGGDKMQAPGGGTDPGENINCRCTLYYTEVKEEE